MTRQAQSQASSGQWLRCDTCPCPATSSRTDAAQWLRQGSTAVTIVRQIVIVTTAPTSAHAASCLLPCPVPGRKGSLVGHGSLKPGRGACSTPQDLGLVLGVAGDRCRPGAAVAGVDHRHGPLRGRMCQRSEIRRSQRACSQDRLQGARGGHTSRMGTLGTSALSIGSALIGGIVGALITNWYVARSNKRSAQRDSIGRLVEICGQLRSVTTRWYEQIAARIDPSQSPDEIVGNLRELWRGGRFQQEISTCLTRLRSEGDDSEAKSVCSQVIETSAVWTDAAFRGKSAASASLGPLYMQVSANPELNRLFERVEKGSDQRQLYLLAVQDKLHLAYRNFDKTLGEAITRLSALQQVHNS
jgi:hypothetical protein